MIEGDFLPASFRQLMADTNSPEAALDALHERAIILTRRAGLNFVRSGGSVTDDTAPFVDEEMDEPPRPFIPFRRSSGSPCRRV